MQFGFIHCIFYHSKDDPFTVGFINLRAISNHGGGGAVEQILVGDVPYKLRKNIYLL